jgi:hypothetical protein
MAAKLTPEEQIALILKKAETATPEEAEMLTGRAEKLMIRHGIDRAMAEAADPSKKDTLDWTTIILKGVYSKAQALMVHSIVSAYGDAKGYIVGSRSGSNTSFRFASFKNDGVALKGLIDSLLLQCVVATDAARKKEMLWKRMTPSEKYNFCRSFILGFGQGAAQRIRETKKIVTEEAKADHGAGTALVLVKKAEAVEKFYDAETAGTLKKGRGINTTYSGYAAGRQAGLNANVGGAARGAVGR